MSIGSLLKQARQKKGVSIEEASSKTKIQERLLEALENDNIQALPNPIYTKSFLKKYAGFLGLDVNSITEEFEKTGSQKVKQVIMLEGERLPAPDSERYLKKVVFGIVVAFVLIGFMTFILSVHRQGKVKPASVRKASVQQKQVKKPPIAQPKPVPKPVITPPPPPEPVVQQPEPAPLVLSIFARKPCRLSVKADDRLLFEGFLLAGRSDKWRAKKRFELSVSDGTAVELALNSRRLGTIARGPIESIFVTKDGISRKKGQN